MTDRPKFTAAEVAAAEAKVIAEADSLRAQLAAVTAQRDELLAAATDASELISELYAYCIDQWDWKYGERWREARDSFNARIARAQPEQPPQPKEEP